MTELVIDLPFTPRAWQEPLLGDRSPRIVAVIHRRAGKSTGLMWRGLLRAAVPTRRDPPMRVVHVLPLSVQWDRTGLWDQLERAAKAFPGSEIRRSERRVILPAGGIYQAGGMDNPDSWRGGYADEVIEDEADDVTGAGLDMVVEPMLADHNGTRIYAGTPKGTGRLQGLWDKAGTTPGWSRYRMTWRDTGALPETAVDRLRMQLSPEEFAQELECSFDAPNSGAYFAKHLDDADRDGRIRAVPYDPRMQVVTCWDLGMDDATAIGFLQLVAGTGEVRAIGYHEASGEDLTYYARHLAGRGYVFDRHHLPHDAQVRELGTGRSRKEMLEGLGVRPIVVGRALPVADGINAVRALMPRIWWDGEGTALWRQRLRRYRREWLEERGVWSPKPLHDENSHGADCLREFAVNFREPRSPVAPPPRTQADNSFDPHRWGT